MAGREAVVGRDPGVDLALAHPALGRQHLKFEAQPDGVVVVSDLGSPSGTRSGARVLTPFKKYRYVNGTPLLLGDATFRFFVEPLAALAPEIVAQAELIAKEILDEAERGSHEAERRVARAARRSRGLSRLETRLRRAVGELETNRRELATRLGNLRESVDLLDERKRVVADGVDTESSLLEQMRTEMERLRAVRAELETRVGELDRERERLEAWESEARLRRSESEAQVGRLRTELGELAERKAGFLAQVDHAWTQAERARADLEASRDEYEERRRSVEGLREEARAEETRLGALREEARDFESKIPGLETRVRESEARVAENEGEAARAEEACRARSAERRQLEDEVARLVAERDGVSVALERVRFESAEAREHFARLSAESESLRRQIDDRAISLRETELELAEMRSERLKLAEALPRLRGELDSAREEARQVRAETTVWAETRRADVERRLESEVAERRGREAALMQAERDLFDREMAEHRPQQKARLRDGLSRLYLDHLSGNPVWGAKAEELRSRFLAHADSLVTEVLDHGPDPTGIRRNWLSRWRNSTHTWPVAVPLAMLALGFVLSFASLRLTKPKLGAALSRHPASSEARRLLPSQKKPVRPDVPSLDEETR